MNGIESVDPRLFRLRIELYTAAQTLKGADADYFWRLIEEIQSIGAALGRSDLA